MELSWLSMSRCVEFPPLGPQLLSLGAREPTTVGFRTKSTLTSSGFRPAFAASARMESR